MFERVQKIIVTAIGFFIIALLAFAFVLHMDHIGSTYNGEAIDQNSGWLDENGNEAKIIGIVGQPGSQVEFHRTVELSKLNGASLCFFSHNILFSVYADDRLIYDFHPTIGGYYGKHYGDYIHTVTLPSDLSEAELRIEATILFNNSWTGFDKMVLQDSGEFLSGIIKQNAAGFIICLLIFGFAVILLIVGLLESIIRAQMIETICLGVITILLSLWTNAQTKILHIITGNPAALRIIDYVVLCLIPIPVIVFVSSFTRNRSNKLMKICVLMCLSNFVFQAIGIPLGLFDYSNALRISHLLILFGIIIISYFIIKAIREKRIDRSQSAYLISALAVIICTGIVDMLRYYIGHNNDFSYMTRLGLMIFVTILTVYEFRQLIEVRIKSHEAEVMQRLAMEDALTGVQSRTAFVEYEKSLLAHQHGICLFIHFDVNFLKKVNDNYGHAEGDKHIIAASKVIQKSFGEYGHCFRVGGDEFFAILDGDNCHNDYKDGLMKFRELQEEYNLNEVPPVPLVIAHGMAEYDYSSHDPESSERLADSRMYEDKKRLKSDVRIPNIQRSSE